MNVLGIESSCDETAVAIVGEGDRLLANCVASQVDAHRMHGGVVPELASRQHILNIVPIYKQALADANLDIASIDGVAATHGPGLVGALLVGLQFAKGVAMARNLPFVGINHLEGHILSPALSGQHPQGAHLALLVSGGHTQLIHVRCFGDYQLIGTTRDDAAGEAFDKVAKMLGLGYPGGPELEKRALNGDAERFSFPRALPRRDEFDFSFSGVKTAVAQTLRRMIAAEPTKFTPAVSKPVKSAQDTPPEIAVRNIKSNAKSNSHTSRRPSKIEHDAGFKKRIGSLNASAIGEQSIADICASFQAAVTDAICKKTRLACTLLGLKTVVAGGGVMANSYLRAQLTNRLADDGVSLIVPPLAFCTDNGAMIALAGRKRLMMGERSDFSMNASSRLPLT